MSLIPTQFADERPKFLRTNHRCIWVLLIAGCICVGAITALAQPGPAYPAANTPANPTPTEKFTVTGSVVDAVSSEPVRKALVQLNAMPRRTAFTDSSGRFQFEGVSAGSVSLTAQKPGYFS